jgi:hypothetical protein
MSVPYAYDYELGLWLTLYFVYGLGPDSSLKESTWDLGARFGGQVSLAW